MATGPFRRTSASYIPNTWIGKKIHSNLDPNTPLQQHVSIDADNFVNEDGEAQEEELSLETESEYSEDVDEEEVFNFIGSMLITTH